MSSWRMIEKWWQFQIDHQYKKVDHLFCQNFFKILFSRRIGKFKLKLVQYKLPSEMKLCCSWLDSFPFELPLVRWARCFDLFKFHTCQVEWRLQWLIFLRIWARSYPKYTWLQVFNSSCWSQYWDTSAYRLGIYFVFFVE